MSIIIIIIIKIVQRYLLVSNTRMKRKRDRAKARHVLKYSMCGFVLIQATKASVLEKRCSLLKVVLVFTHYSM